MKEGESCRLIDVDAEFSLETGDVVLVLDTVGAGDVFTEDGSSQNDTTAPDTDEQETSSNSDAEGADSSPDDSSDPGSAPLDVPAVDQEVEESSDSGGSS